MNALEIYLSPAHERARKIAARRLGLVLAKFELLRAAQRKWCSGCQCWHAATPAIFGASSAKGDGMQSVCRLSRAVINAARRRKERAA